MVAEIVGVYINNTSISYTAQDLLNIKSWADDVDDSIRTGYYVSPSLQIIIKENSSVFFSIVSWVRLGIEINQIADGIKHGECFTYKDLSYVFKTYYRGEKIGEEKEFDKKTNTLKTGCINFGHMHLVSTHNNLYFNNKKFGKFIEHYVYGFIVGYYLDGKYHGVVETYRHNDEGEAVLKQKENYLLGILHGEQTTYYKDGNISSKCTYVGGSLHGKQTHYYHDGSISTEVFYILDQLVTEEEFVEYNKKYGKYIEDILNKL